MKLATSVSVLSAILLTACASSPEPAYFSLAAGQETRAPQANFPSVLITRTRIPEAVDRPQLVLYGQGQQLHISEQWRWAGPLRREIPRLLAFQLGQALGSGQVSSGVDDSQARAIDFRIEIDVLRFEMQSRRVAIADMQWRIIPAQGAPLAGRSEAWESAKSDDINALVEAQRNAIAKAAEDIAREIRRLGRGT